MQPEPLTSEQRTRSLDILQYEQGERGSLPSSLTPPRDAEPLVWPPLSKLSRFWYCSDSTQRFHQLQAERVGDGWIVWVAGKVYEVRSRRLCEACEMAVREATG